MKTPVTIRPLTENERQRIQTGLRSPDAFLLRRCQILLAAAQQKRVPQIAQHLSCSDQTVLNVIHGFNTSGLAVLQKRSSCPHRLHPAFSDAAAEQVAELLHRSPRDFGRATSLWTLELVAQVSFEQGLTAAQVSYESVRRLLKRLGLNWKRAKHWITSPDPQYQQKKNDVTN